MNFEVVKLTEVMRQSEKEYIDALNALKLGDKKVKDYFNTRYDSSAVIPAHAIYLFGTNAEVERKNSAELAKLHGETHTFKNQLMIKPGFQGKIQTMFADTLELKVGARVMAVVNDKLGDYSNGSLGTVIRILENEIHVEFDNGKIVPVERAEEEHFTYKVDYNIESGQQEIVKDWQYTECNFPLKLAYAITIHKSQGQTFDSVVIHPTCFANGQLYVALSRCRTFSGIYLLKKIEDKDIRISQTVIEFELENNII